jgi:hypothetical protein
MVDNMAMHNIANTDIDFTDTYISVLISAKGYLHQLIACLFGRLLIWQSCFSLLIVTIIFHGFSQDVLK